MYEDLYKPLAQVTYGYYTYQASTQDSNEDAVGYGCGRLGHVLVVADGVGGEERGRMASQTVVNRIVNDIANDGLWAPANSALKYGIRRANMELLAMQQLVPRLKGMASTCVAALISNGKLHVGHVGNSRCYLVRGKQMWRLTRDHTLVEDMVDSGEVKRAEALDRPEANMLHRGMGLKSDTEVEMLAEPVALEPNDRICLMSDGILHKVSEREVARFVRELDPQQACNDLLGLAYERQSTDDKSIAILRFDSPGA